MVYFRVALVQMQVSEDHGMNLKTALKNIATAKEGGARLIALPECFNSPYGIQYFQKYAESITTGPTCEMLSKAAKEHSVYLVGGTIPEVENNRYYNTCSVWNPEGQLIAKYRKMHLFDIDIPGKITFKESEVLSAGNELVIFDMDGIKIGLGICHDIRFEEQAKLYRLKGCKILIYPGAFEMVTGQLYWELLQRSRANDNQLFVFAISPARNDTGYISWSHSQVTDPWGKIIALAGYEEEIIYANINSRDCDEVRQQIPIFNQRRIDTYDTIRKF